MSGWGHEETISLGTSTSYKAKFQLLQSHSNCDQNRGVKCFILLYTEAVKPYKFKTWGHRIVFLHLVLGEMLQRYKQNTFKSVIRISHGLPWPLSSGCSQLLAPTLAYTCFYDLRPSLKFLRNPKAKKGGKVNSVHRIPLPSGPLRLRVCSLFCRDWRQCFIQLLSFSNIASHTKRVRI